MPKIEYQRPISKICQNSIHAGIKRLTTCNDTQRIKIALHCPLFLQFSGKRQRHRPIKPQHVNAGLFTIAGIKHSCSLWEAYDSCLRMNSTNLLHDPRHWPDAETLKTVFIQNARPGIENLDSISPCLKLFNQILGRNISQIIQKLFKGFREAIGKQTCRCLIRCAVPGNHIGRNCPWSAAETKQGCFIRQLSTQQPHCFINRFQPLGCSFGL